MLLVVALPAAAAGGSANTASPIAGACDGKLPVTYVEKIPESQLEYLWRDTRVHPSGYLETIVPSDYLNVIEHMLAVSSTKIGERQAPSKVLPWHRIGALDETPHRITTFYSDGSSEVMLTRWGYAADGARLCFFDAFLNVKVGDARGTISLAKSSSPDERHALWKVTWVPMNQPIQLEFYLQDRLDSNGDPSRTVREVVDLAIQIAS
jgi:hypothetical protein